MQQLEQLYDLAEETLGTSQPIWDEFAMKFSALFYSNIALYRTNTASISIDLTNVSEILSTNCPAMLSQFFGDDIYASKDFQTKLIVDPDTSFEPTRRSDTFESQSVKDLDVWEQFLKPHGLYYIMQVLAILPDGTALVLGVWRDEDGADFSELEKQRLALFMRFLSKIVGVPAPTPILPEQQAMEVENFGKKYSLTKAEIEVLSALLMGQSPRIIANQSNRTYGTVRWHVRNILEKCQVNTQQNLLSEFYRLIKR